LPPFQHAVKLLKEFGVFSGQCTSATMWKGNVHHGLFIGSRHLTEH